MAVDGESGVRGGQERELEQPAEQRLAPGDGDEHDRRDEEKDAVILEHVDADAGRALAHQRVARGIERRELAACALAEAREVGVDHGARVGERLAAGAVRVYGL